MAYRNATWPVWVEHFASALGMPSALLSFTYWGASRPDTKWFKEKTPIVVFLMPIFLSFLCMVVLVYGEAAHEVDQLLLSKSSNYGQHIADFCLPAGDIHSLAVCAMEYRPTLYRQGIADLAGSLTFLVLLAVFTWRIAVAQVRNVSTLLNKGFGNYE